MKKNSNQAKNKRQFKLEQIRGSVPTRISGSQNLTVRESVQPTYKFDIPLAPTQFTVASGLLAAVAPVNTNVIPNFSTRFGALFQEYRILGAHITIRQSVVPTGTISGVTTFFLDEKSGAAPTASNALDRPRIEAANQLDNSDKVHSIKWVANDLLDLDYTAIGTLYTPVWMKVYTDITNFGSAATTTVGWIVSGAVRVELRGFI